MGNKDSRPRPGREVIRIRGKNTTVPSVEVFGRKIIRTGGWLKTAALMDEELVEGEPVETPAEFVGQLRASRLGADILTFHQRATDPHPKHLLYWEPENLAVIPTRSFKEWWENRLPQESRKNVRRAAKREVMVREVSFDDELVRGIKAIYDETPVRQGRTFWHYQKEFGTVKAESGTYPDRSWFIGAYFKDELIGFIKVTMVGQLANIVHIIAKNEHQDKRPMNALLAHAVEMCDKRGVSYLVYGRYRYGRKQGDSLAEFKRRNGFEELVFPRYYVPLTFKGRMALRLGVHLGLANIIPRPVADFLLKFRSKLMQLRAGRKTTCADEGRTATEIN